MLPLKHSAVIMTLHWITACLISIPGQYLNFGNEDSYSLATFLVCGIALFIVN